MAPDAQGHGEGERMSRTLTAFTLLLLSLPIPALAGPTPGTNNVVTVRGGAPQLLIPAAGHVPGANGTLFRSEINVVNYTDRAQRVQLRWLPQIGGNFPVVTITINPLSGVGAEDFVPAIMNIPSGFGAILVTGVTASDAIDPGARLVATDRIWTFQPGSDGTVSQTFDVLQTSDVNAVTGNVSILGLRRDNQYRLNVGIVNLAATTQVFVITTSAQDSMMVTVPALSSQQVAVGGPATAANLQIIVSNATAGSSRSVQWVAYGSSVDNITGDSWSMMGYVPLISTMQP
jgi:hypothetical protein